MMFNTVCYCTGECMRRGCCPTNPFDNFYTYPSEWNVEDIKWNPVYQPGPFILETERQKELEKENENLKDKLAAYERYINDLEKRVDDTQATLDRVMAERNEARGVAPTASKDTLKELAAAKQELKKKETENWNLRERVLRLHEGLENLVSEFESA